MAIDKDTLQRQMREEQKRRKREQVIIFIAIPVVLALTSLLLYVSGRSGEALLPQNILVFSLINLNAILLLMLLFLVVRNVVKLFFERRRGILGSKLRTKLVIAFVGLSLVPTMLLFWVSISFITNTIENWFSFKVENSLEESLNVVDAYYRNSSSKALHYARQIAGSIAAKKMLGDRASEPLWTLVAEKQSEYDLGVVEIFSVNGELLVKVARADVPEQDFIGSDAALVLQALEGKEITRIQPAGDGDIIRGVVPVRIAGGKQEIIGAVVVNYYNPKSLVIKMDAINRAYQEYKQLKISKDPIKGIYVILLSAVTLLIIFSATWFGFHLSKVISVPIGSLAAATEQIAQGNLDFEIQPSSDDEIGSLINSFNKMTHDLKASKEQVESTTGNLRETIRELEHRRLYMEILLDNVASVVISTDQDGIVTAFNNSAERMFNTTLAQVIGRPYLAVLAAEDLAPLKEFIDDIIAYQLQSVEQQIALSLADRMIFLYVRSNMLFDADNNYMGLVLVAEDLTQLQQAQRAFAWKEVARRIAHEVKNPLTPIKLSAQRLKKKFQPQIKADMEIFDECTTTIINQVDELKTMVNEFSSFARMPATNPLPNDLNEVVDETLSLYREAHKLISFVAARETDTIRFSFDRDQIKRVFINLLDNAVHSMENEGAVTVRTAYNQALDAVIIEVADTGCGIPPSLKTKIFDPYFSTKKAGTGLGLAIVNTIVSDHNGFVRVRDNKPQGTCFIIQLPVTPMISYRREAYNEKFRNTAG
ncbi:MAG: ATP-binding protein [Proteobacteria bacterium]|nr:ATP-binding protein [Pseudomonadota bacterium]